jgi:hypothetical protein
VARVRHARGARARRSGEQPFQERFSSDRGQPELEVCPVSIRTREDQASGQLAEDLASVCPQTDVVRSTGATWPDVSRDILTKHESFVRFMLIMAVVVTVLGMLILAVVMVPDLHELAGDWFKR